MTEKKALELIYQLPRLGGGKAPDGLRQLLFLLHDPQNELRYIHVAGTNGKGSVCTMTAAVLQAAGYRVGLYTSPYIHEFRERFRINGRPINSTAFTRAARKVFTALGNMPKDEPLPLAQFDVVTAIAFEIFASEHCDFVVLECGLGGRLDATNVIAAPLVAAVTNIGFDHTEILGDTIHAIAREKCGIFKSGTGAVVCAPQDYPDAEAVMTASASEAGIPLRLARQEDIAIIQCALGSMTFSYRGEAYRSSLMAAYQARNAATALEILFALREGGLTIPDEAIAFGLSHAYIPARLELMSMAPHILLDGAHNADGLRSLCESMEALSRQYDRLFCLCGMLRDKDPRHALSAFFDAPIIRQKLVRIVTVTPNSPRACPAAELADMLATVLPADVGITAFADCGDALRDQLSRMTDRDVLLCFGSLYAMGDLRRVVMEHYNKKGAHR